MKATEFIIEGVAGPKNCWPGYRKTGTQPGTGKNKGKRVNDCEKIKEDEVEESGLQYYTGVKKHGEKYMKAAAAAGREGASQEELGALKDRLSKAHKGKAKNESVAEGNYTTEKQILTRIRQIMYDRKLSGTESNTGELHRLKQQLKDIRSQQGVAEGSGGTKYKIKSIGYDAKGDYYISPSTGKKVYKKGVKVGDHENPKTGEHKSVAESEKKGLYYYVNKRKKAGTSRDASHPKAPTAQAWKDAAKTAKKEDLELEQEFDLIESIIEQIADQHAIDVDLVWEDLSTLTDDELYVFAVTSEMVNEDWQKANKRDKTDGMSKKAVNAYRRENPGSKLKTAVTTKPSKLKRGSKASKRRKSYCSRSRGQMSMHNISCAKTPDKAICKARRRWNC